MSQGAVCPLIVSDKHILSCFREPERLWRAQLCLVYKLKVGLVDESSVNMIKVEPTN